MIVIGLISGTSFDAIDAAAGELTLEGEDLHLVPLGDRSIPYSSDLGAMIAAALPPAPTTAEAVCRLDTLIGQELAAAATTVNREVCGGAAQVVASHGQTVFHWVQNGAARGTLQLGDPAWIAEATGLPVVSGFRSPDVAAGGQGAPLVSTFDTLLLGGARLRCAALNLGGIANLTVVLPGRDPLGYDTGPGNALMDAAAKHYSGGRETYDVDGRRAGRGRVHEGLLRALLDDPYYGRESPKTTGKERFNLGYLLAAMRPYPEIAADDVLATVTAVTASTVAAELRRWQVAEAMVAGGGVRNPVLMRMLEDENRQTRLRSANDWGISAEAKEAYAFAVLGWLSFHGLPGTVPSCTGARKASRLGSITPGSERLSPPPTPSEPPKRLLIGDGAS